jgi:hypothetical protein
VCLFCENLKHIDMDVCSVVYYAKQKLCGDDVKHRP